jgi:hypothetical protein
MTLDSNVVASVAGACLGTSMVFFGFLLYLKRQETKLERELRKSQTEVNKRFEAVLFESLLRKEASAKRNGEDDSTFNVSTTEIYK